MIHFLIVQLGSDDLMVTALASIDRFAGHCNVDVVKLPLDTRDPRAHGQAIDDWRRFQQVSVMDRDVVCIMDPDVVLLSAQWRVAADEAFDNPHVGIWGAGAQEDFGPRVHASLLCVRGSIFNTLERSFTPCLDLREQTWRDTGGLYCMWVKHAGHEVRPLERGPDWHGAAAWWGRVAVPRQRLPVWQPVPLWAHLGGGSHSDPTRMTPWQRLRNWRLLQKRQRFLAAARAYLRA